jgi:hypothetical protein
MIFMHTIASVHLIAYTHWLISLCAFQVCKMQLLFVASLVPQGAYTLLAQLSA